MLRIFDIVMGHYGRHEALRRLDPKKLEPSITLAAKADMLNNVIWRKGVYDPRGHSVEKGSVAASPVADLD